MAGAIAHAVAGAAVARRGADRDAQSHRGLQRVVQRAEGLRRPTGFGRAPADRQHRGLVRLVVQGLADGIGKAGLGVGREVHGQRRGRGQGAGNLDVQRHLAVGAVGVAPRVGLGTIDRHGHHLGRRHPQLREIGREVGRQIAAAQLDQADALPLAVAGRKAVELPQLQRREALRAGAGRPKVRPQGRAEAKVRSRLGLVVQTQHRRDHALQRVRQPHRTGMVAKVPQHRAVLLLEALQLHAEGGVELRHRARQDHAP